MLYYSTGFGPSEGVSPEFWRVTESDSFSGSNSSSGSESNAFATHKSSYSNSGSSASSFTGSSNGLGGLTWSESHSESSGNAAAWGTVGSGSDAEHYSDTYSGSHKEDVTYYTSGSLNSGTTYYKKMLNGSLYDSFSTSRTEEPPKVVIGYDSSFITVTGASKIVTTITKSTVTYVSLNDLGQSIISGYTTSQKSSTTVTTNSKGSVRLNPILSTVSATGNQKFYGAIYNNSWDGGKIYKTKKATGKFSDCFESVAGSSFSMSRGSYIINSAVYGPSTETKYSSGEITYAAKGTQINNFFYITYKAFALNNPVTVSEFLGVATYGFYYMSTRSSAVDKPDASFYTRSSILIEPFGDYINKTVTLEVPVFYRTTRKEIVPVFVGTHKNWGKTVVTPELVGTNIRRLYESRHDRDRFKCTFKTVPSGYLGVAGSYNTNDTSSMPAYKSLTTRTRGNNFGGPHFNLANHQSLTALFRKGGTVVIQQIESKNDTYFVSATAPKNSAKSAEFTANFFTTSLLPIETTSKTILSFADSSTTKAMDGTNFSFNTGISTSVYSYSAHTTINSTHKDYTETNVTYNISVSNRISSITRFSASYARRAGIEKYIDPYVTFGTAGDIAGFSPTVMSVGHCSIHFTMCDRDDKTSKYTSVFTPKNQPNMLTIPKGNIMYFEAHALFTTDSYGEVLAGLEDYNTWI